MAHKLKKYKEYSTSIFISHEFSTEYIINENDVSKMRQDMIKKVVSTGIRGIAILKLHKLVGEIWTSVLTVEASNCLYLETALMYNSLNILQFIVRTILATERGRTLVNAFTTTIYLVF